MVSIVSRVPRNAQGAVGIESSVKAYQDGCGSLEQFDTCDSEPWYAGYIL